MPEQPKQSGFIVAVLAVLGLFSLPQVLKVPDGGSSHSRAEKNVGESRDNSDDEVEEGHRRDLKPLLEYLSNGEPRSTRTADLSSQLRDQLSDTRVHCLVITLPDPIESVASSRFDEYLDVVQRAVELQGYVLDRSLLPWRRKAGSPGGPADRVTKLRVGDRDLLTVETTTPSKENEVRPGVMVFRHAFPGKGQPPKAPSLLLAFLVPESPIHGIHKRAFAHSLDLIDTYFQNKLTRAAGENRAVLHIIAPCFNSSQRSLEVAIGEWGNRHTNRYHFRVISSGTNQIDQDRLTSLFPEGALHKSTFLSMVHQINGLKNAVIDYLTLSQRYRPAEIAILVESNTGLAQALVQDERKKALDDAGVPVEFLFPLQVSEVRKAYEKGACSRTATWTRHQPRSG